MSEKKRVQIYMERVEGLTEDLRRLKRTGNFLSFGRLLIFVLGITLVYLASGIHFSLSIVLFFLFIGLFFLTVKQHGKNLNKQKHIDALITINHNEAKAFEGDIRCFHNGAEYISTGHAYSFDLDLFGDGSLFQYLNRTCSLGGKETLKNWVNEPMTEEVKIKSKQEAIDELSHKLDWRQNFLATGNIYSETGEEEESIRSWADQIPVFDRSIKMNAIRFLFPSITGIVLILSILSILPASIPIGMFLLQLTIIAFHLATLNKAHRQVARRYEMLSKYSNLLLKIEDEEFTSPYLKEIKNKLIHEAKPASYYINSLANVIHRFDRRLDMILGVLLNGLFLWDIHCVVALDRWKENSQKQIPIWFSVINEIDAAVSLAGYCYNNPEYIFPGMANEKIIEAKDLGHPLIDEKVRVTNDFSIEKPGSLVILTGPNMAGKSTFLRTVGINLILGMTGAPVCADKFIFTPVRIYSSMRTSDSLQKNESYFYAELRRLKTLKGCLLKKEKIFILLDEILKGTNSRDKHIGSKLFIEQLVKMNGTGLIATHDVELGKMEQEFPDNISNMCFEVDIDGEHISFDYILREGTTQKMNAAYLMKQMGIV